MAAHLGRKKKKKKRKEIKTGVRIREDITVIRGTDENTARDANWKEDNVTFSDKRKETKKKKK